MTRSGKKLGSGAGRQDDLLKEQYFLPPGPAVPSEMQALVIMKERSD